MKNAFKKAFTAAVAVMTIVWSVGVVGLVPGQVKAATAGDVIKGTTLSTVYYYGSDGYRYAFPNEKTYFTWYEDFSDVETISDSALAAISLAGNVVYRPGSRWIKIQSDPKTYAVTTDGSILWIETEEVAEGLAGSDWNAFIDDVSDTFFVDYTVGNSLTSAEDAYEGALVSDDTSTYVVWGGEKLAVSDDGMEANRFQSRFVLDGSGVDLASMTAGDDLDAEDTELTDTAQLGGVVVTGGLSVSLASDTAASSTVPASASAVDFTTFKLVATDGDVTVDQMIVKMGGIGNVDDFGDLYLYEGDTRLTEGRSLNSSTRVATFSALDLEIAEGDTVYVTLSADIDAAPTGGDTVNFYLASEDSITSDATVSGSFPVSGNTMTLSETEVGELIVTRNGTVTDPTLGEEGATIAKFKLEADGEDASIERIALNVDKAADHSNFVLMNGDDELATGTADGDLVTFVLASELEIADGDSETLELLADVGGENSDEINVAVEEASDILAVGGDYGYNLAINIDDYDLTGTSCDGDDCSQSEVLGGELTFAFNGPSTSDIEIDGSDEVFMNFSITAENWTEVKEMTVHVNGTDLVQADDDLNLQDITIREEDGSVWMGPEELDADGNDNDQDVDFSDTQILQTGETIDLMITADIDADAPEAAVYSMDLDMSETGAEDVNGDELDPAEDIVPTGDIEGHDMTIVAASLTVSLSTPPTSGTYVKGTSGVSMMALSFNAGETSDATITEITYSANGDSDGTPGEDDIDVADHISSCSIYDNSTGSLVDGPESINADEQVTFDSFDWTVEAGETAKLLLKCNFSNTALDAGNVGDDAYTFFLTNDGAENTDDVVAEDEEGDDLVVGLDDEDTNDDSTVFTTIADTGDLTATLSGSSAKSTIVLGESDDVSIAKYKFDADEEAFTVQTLSLFNCVNWDGSGACDGAAVAGEDGVASAVYVTYTNTAGEEETKTGYLSDNVVTFDNLDFYVGTTSTETLEVTIDTSEVGGTGVDSESMIQLNLIDDEFEAIGAGSSETLDDIDEIASNEMVVRKTKPTFSLASGSPSGAGSPGFSEVYRFNVAADSRGYVTLNQVVFKLNATDGEDSGWSDCDATDLGADAVWELYDYEDSSTKLDTGGWTFVEADGSACEANDELGYAILSFEDSDEGAQEIGAGETKTYVLKVDTNNAESPSTTDDDSIRIDIPDETETRGLATAWDAIIWDDADTGGDGDDVDGTYIKNLPVTGSTVTY